MRTRYIGSSPHLNRTIRPHRREVRPRMALAAVALWLLAPLARADTVLDWNVIALRTTAAAPFNPPLEARSLAIVHAAMFDAVRSITHSR